MNLSSYERLKHRYRELIGVRCEDCGKEYFPKQYRCRNCGSYKMVDAKMPDTGKLESYTILNVPSSEFKGSEPIVLGIVELENGVRLLSQIEADDINSLSQGIKVKMKVANIKDSFEVFKFHAQKQ
jgi:uncharacterized OB-fold protein